MIPAWKLTGLIAMSESSLLYSQKLLYPGDTVMVKVAGLDDMEGMSGEGALKLSVLLFQKFL